MIHSVVVGLIFFSVVAAMVCIAAAVAHTIHAISLRKPGVSLWKDTLLNPANLLLQPEKLSDAGIAARHRVVISYAGFFVFGFLAIVALAIEKAIR